MQALEGRVIRRHTAVMQIFQRVHALFRHVLLRQHDSDLFGAVIAVIEEDNHIAVTDTSVASRVHQRLHKLIGIFVLLSMTVVATLYSSHHIGLFAPLAINQLIVSHLDALPTFVTVHGVETTYDGSYMGAVRIAHALQVLYKTLTAARVGVTTVHEAMHEGLISYAVFLRDLHQLEQVIQRRVYTAVGAQTHNVQFFAFCLCSLVSSYYLRVLQNRVVTDRAVDLHQVLINDTTGTDIEVPHFGVSHLSVRQTYVLTARLQLRVRVLCQQRIPMRRRRHTDHIGFTLVSDAPAIQNH